ncbi:uncharacterized protein BDR25DRAFT_335021 [Lindgomyces ingoldianus]|uniref:Uncharacterized protein n=1 Tax=Lindgomyces ingoldianus TaxID=673940 RepID=A0ACB6QSK9_9PLEO|nr:uncharacterized protein BDR25DRAFT_335021 [Lindgomyces ingoldianus]KAF2469510.1 hypothetical protein BDR25DRAFT_335021 [Lindgomyces ingoldianus]
MGPVLDLGRLRASSTPLESSKYFRHLLASSSVETLSLQLLEAVERGSLEPSIFDIWLGVTKSPSAISLALKQNVSIQIRKSGIKRVGKQLRSSKWKETWDGLGGIRGLLDLFVDLSVLEVKQMCYAIARSAVGYDVEEKRKRTTEFLKALLSDEFPETEHRNPDPRPMAQYYKQLVPGCTSAFITFTLCKPSKDEWNDIPHKLLLRYHADTLRPICLQMVFGSYPLEDKWLSALLERWPSSLGSLPRFSASLQFSFDILKRAAQEESSTISTHGLIRRVVEPLLRRALRRRVGWMHIQEIVGLALKYLEKEPDAAIALEWNNGSLLDLALSAWRRRPKMFETQVTALFSHGRQKHSYLENIWEIEKHVGKVAPSQRYEKLKFCVFVAMEIDIDIDSDLKRLQAYYWNDIFHLLDAGQALGLFTRICAAKGNDCVNGDLELMEIDLLRKSGSSEKARSVAQQSIQWLKKKAMSNPDQSQRASHIKLVVEYAVASGSLPLHFEVLQWTRRFIRDPLTVPVLHQSHMDEEKDLLCAISPDTPKQMTPLQLRSCVVEANKALRFLFETACLALREPSYAGYHWQGTLDLFLHIVERRMQRVPTLKKDLNLSDDQVYHIVWEDTLQLLLDVEKDCLKSDNKELSRDTAQGCLGYQGYSKLKVKGDDPSTYRFFDNFAKARDDIWQEYRPTIHPSAATLPAPYPRGLPIQTLIGPFILRTASLDILAPYIASRTNAAIFLDPIAALTPYPEDEDDRTAIGQFVDDYHFAMKMFVPKCLPHEEKKRRLQRAWDHAIRFLSRPRMSDDEGLRYWQCNMQHKYREFWPKDYVPRPDYDDYPTIPIVDEPSEVVEWNPLPPRREDIDERAIEMTYVDLSIAGEGFFSPDPYPGLPLPDNIPTEVPGKTFEQAAIWSKGIVEEAKRKTPVREGQILSALLYLDTINKSDTRILPAPFPAESDIRYPTAYLDEQFLRKDDLSMHNAISTLRCHLKSAPVALLARLTENTIASLDKMRLGDPDYNNIERLAFSLVHLLTQSDRPDIASNLAVRAIIQRPDASSWHRTLLKPGFLRRLPTAQAQQCVSAFAAAVITKLREQVEAKKMAQERSPEAKESDTANEEGENGFPQPYIKVTTIKYLAQLLNGADFISKGFTLGLLTTLSQKTTHIDIQNAVLGSLLSILKTSGSPQDGDETLPAKVLKCLETAIPLAGQLDERHPLSESDWESISSNLTLPEVNFYDIPAMLAMLYDFLANVSQDFPHRTAYTNRIILPIIDRQKQQTKRWIDVFLKKYAGGEKGIEELKIPIPPRASMVWLRLLQTGTTHLPATLVEEYLDFTIFYLSKPDVVCALNKRFDDDPALRTRKDVSFWLSLFYNNSPISSFGTYLIGLLKKDFRPTVLSEEMGITVAKAQEWILKLFTAIMAVDAPRYHSIHYLTTQLAPPFSVYQTSDEDRKTWVENTKPVVEAIIAYINTLRTKEWLSDPNRKPPVLPDTYVMRLWLLKYPGLPLPPGESVTQEERCKVFAEEVAKLVDRISGRLYHNKLGFVKEALKRVMGNDVPRVAICLGDISNTRLSWLTLHDQLRIELAEELLNNSSRPDDAGLVEQVEKMVKTWQVSDNEDIRRKGYDLMDIWSGFGLFD